MNNGLFRVSLAGIVISNLLPAQSSAKVPPAQSNSGYYRPVAPAPQKAPPCGHYGTPPCAVLEPPPESVNIPPGATPDRIFDMGVEYDKRRQHAAAAVCFQKAAEMGHVRAEAAIGLKYTNAKGVPKDPGKAFYWLGKASQGGHRVAQCQMGEFYQEGDGVNVDMQKAVRYYQLSAAQHYWRAEFLLGIAYDLGTGVPRNRATAIAMLDRAAGDGQNGLAQQLVTMLRRSDTPRFANAEQMTAHLGALVQQAYAEAFPQPPPGGKHCHEFYSPANKLNGTYICN